MKTNLQRLSLLLVLISVAFLPGCAPWHWLKSKFGGSSASVQTTDIAEGDVVLLTLDGKPIITAQSLNKDMEQLLIDNPQLQQILPFMENAEHDIFMGMVNQEVVNKYIEDKGINQSQAYQDELARMLRSVRYMLNTKYFASEHPVQVTDAEIKKYYEEHKETMPGLMLSRGGVDAKGVAFDTDSQAKAFVEKTKGKDFATTAREAGQQVRDFKTVNKQTVGIDAGLRDKILAIKKFPTVEVIKADGKHWVITATALQTPKYCDYDQAKAALQQQVEKEKRTEMFDKEINNLKKHYNLVINEDYFKKPAAPAMPMQQSEAEAVTAPVHTA